MRTLFWVARILFYARTIFLAWAFESDQSLSTECTVPIGDICLDADYNSRNIPLPIHVDFTIYNVQIVEVDDFHNTVTITAMFNFGWIDNRLRNRHLANDTWQNLDAKWHEKIWYPDMFIRRVISFKKFHYGKHSTSKNLQCFLFQSPHINNEINIFAHFSILHPNNN